MDFSVVFMGLGPGSKLQVDRLMHTAVVACGLGPDLYWKPLLPTYILKGSKPVVWLWWTAISLICQLKSRRHKRQLTPR